jgi:hypothetical protein
MLCKAERSVDLSAWGEAGPLPVHICSAPRPPMAKGNTRSTRFPMPWKEPAGGLGSPPLPFHGGPPRPKGRRGQISLHILRMFSAQFREFAYRFQPLIKGFWSGPVIIRPEGPGMPRGNQALRAFRSPLVG